MNTEDLEQSLDYLLEAGEFFINLRNKLDEVSSLSGESYKDGMLSLMQNLRYYKFSSLDISDALLRELERNCFKEPCREA